MPRSRPGYKPYTKGRITDERESWVTLHHFELVRMVIDEETNPLQRTQPDKPGDKTHRLSFRYNGAKKPFVVDLTAMTGEEIRAFREFVLRAIDLATPVCDKLDQRAKTAWEQEGDDSYARLYRRVPEIIVRSRFSEQHNSGVQSRPDGTAGVPGYDARPEQFKRNRRSVFDGEQEGLEAGDDSSQASDVQGIRALHGGPNVPSDLQGTEGTEGDCSPDSGGDDSNSEDDRRGEAASP